MWIIDLKWIYGDVAVWVVVGSGPGGVFTLRVLEGFEGWFGCVGSSVGMNRVKGFHVSAAAKSKKKKERNKNSS